VEKKIIKKKYKDWAEVEPSVKGGPEEEEE
jgi:hypothetical protein